MSEAWLPVWPGALQPTGRDVIVRRRLHRRGYGDGNASMPELRIQLCSDISSHSTREPGGRFDRLRAMPVEPMVIATHLITTLTLPDGA